jgi:hypothetical protein
MRQEHQKLLDQVSLSLLRDISRLEDELNGSDLDGARDVSASIPAILLAIAVKRLAMELPPEEVAALLQAMASKVETGAFHGGPDFPGWTGPCGGDDGGGDDGGGGGRTLN